MWVMRGADDDACLRMEGARQVGDGRRRHRPKQNAIATRGRQARLQRRLEHVAGNARVLAHENPACAHLAKGHARRPTQFEHEIRGDRELTHTTADAVGAEVFFTGHGCSKISYFADSTAAIIRTTSTVCATSCTRKILAPLIMAMAARASAP